MAKHSLHPPVHCTMWQIFLIVTSSIKMSWSQARTTTAAEEGGCPLGWIDDGAMGCFLFSADTVGLSWIEALEFCEEQVSNQNCFQ